MKTTFVNENDTAFRYEYENILYKELEAGKNNF